MDEADEDAMTGNGDWTDADERIASAYQAAGIILDRIGLFESEEGQSLLDMLSNTKVPIPDRAWVFEVADPARPAESAIEAIAEAWASIDGKLEAFKREKGMNFVENHGKPGFTGHYKGYMVEAAEMIKRVERRGFVVVAKE